jgi:Fic family protein
LPPSPLLCTPEQKPKLEARNGVDQIGYIDYLVNKLQAVELRESHVQEFHAIAVNEIYPCGGRYRDARMDVVIQGSDHRLPPAAQVPSLVSDLITKLNSERDTVPALDRAAYALWRLNWIHPFAGGNGRTARALCYSVICMGLGLVPPGTPQFPTVIYERRKEYVQALKAADAAELKTGEPELTPMRAIVEDALMRQLAAVIDSLGKPRPLP